MGISSNECMMGIHSLLPDLVINNRAILGI